LLIVESGVLSLPNNKLAVDPLMAEAAILIGNGGTKHQDRQLSDLKKIHLLLLLNSSSRAVRSIADIPKYSTPNRRGASIWIPI
jgi:hypothetical protein